MPSVFAHGLLPVPEMGGERIVVQRQAIAGENGEFAGSQAADQLMNELIGQGLSAWAQHESWDQLGASVAGDPQPGSFGSAAEL